MSKTIKNDKYICLSAILRAKEAKLLGREKIEQMLSGSFADAYRVAAESGYADMSGMDVSGVNTALAQHRAEELEDIGSMIPDSEIIDLFRMKYGYHNAKALVKAGGDITRCESLLSASAHCTPEQIKGAYDTDGAGSELTAVFAAAIGEAKQALARTGNPQLADSILDKAYFAELLAAANASGKKFILDFVRCRIDKGNLRSALRTLGMGKREELLKSALIEGGTISTDEIFGAGTREDLIRLFSTTIFLRAAEAQDMTEFEKAADNAEKDYVMSGSLISFGPEVVVEYVSALENELVLLRIVLTGKLMNIGTETLRERLRESYV